MHQWTVYKVYIKCIGEDFFSNDDFPVFNTHLTWILMDLEKISEIFFLILSIYAFYHSMDSI